METVTINNPSFTLTKTKSDYILRLHSVSVVVSCSRGPRGLTAANKNVMNTQYRRCKRSISCRGFYGGAIHMTFKCFPEVISVMTLAAANLIAGFICTGAGASDSISFSSCSHCDIRGDCLSLAALEDNAAVFLPFSASVSVLLL